MSLAGRMMLAAIALMGGSSFAQQPVSWSRRVLELDPVWYATPQARALADNVLRYQSPEGGWPKNLNLAVWPPADRDAGFATDGRANTFDNGATTLPMEFLARVVSAGGAEAHRKSFDRGLAYVLRAQYPNGGWPQFHPLREGYYSRITFNDDAMVRVLTLLRAVAAGRAPYEFVDASSRMRAAAAVKRGIALILRTQIRQQGEPTAWCAQYDEKTLAPAWARAYEPPSLSGSESVGILRLLMGEAPTPDIIAAVEGGVRWLEKVAVQGLRLEHFTDGDGNRDVRVVAQAGAEPLWARFYELETNRPIFLGRDSQVRYALAEIERERRAGYAYYGNWARDLLARDYLAWKQGLIERRSLSAPSVAPAGRVAD